MRVSWGSNGRRTRSERIAALAAVAALEAKAGPRPSASDPKAVEFDRQLAQLAAMTPVGGPR